MSKVAFLFPGQGAQSVGMGRQACEAYESVRILFQRAEELLGYDLKQLCFEGPTEQLNSTVHSQPGLFVCGLAGLEVLKHESPEVVDACEAAAGLSLGEYTAMVFAGVMDFESGLRVVQQRGQAMQEASDATPSGMVSVLGMELDELQQLCSQVRGDDEVLQVANHLCPGNIAVSGHTTACHRLAEAAVEAGAMKAVPLAVAGAFHTPLMESAVEKLSSAIQNVELTAPRIPVVSNVDARPHSDPEEIRQLLIQQVVSPVRWEDSIRYLVDNGHDLFYEVGPGRVLRALLKRIHRKTKCEGVDV